MWILFGIAALLTAAVNIVCTIRRRDAKWFRFLSLSFTALTVCAFYDMVRQWVLREDWSALMDVVPTTGSALWLLTTASIVINGLSLFRKNDK